MSGVALSLSRAFRIAATTLGAGAFGWVVMAGYRADLSPFPDAPLDAVALRDLAMKARQGGREAEADRLIQLAARLGWRDGMTQRWMLERALGLGDHQDAVRRIDALLRRRPEAAKTLLPVLHALAMDQAGRDAILQRLAAAPPWRSALFRDVDTMNAAMTTGHEALLDQMIAKGVVAPREEVLPYVNRLMAQGHVDRARRLWNCATGLSDAEELAGNLAEIDPTLTPDQIAPFEWRLNRVSGAELLPEAAGQSPGLRIRMDSSTFGTLMERVVLLRPGAYRLSLAATDDRPLKDGRIRWTLFCRPDRQRIMITPWSARVTTLAGQVAWFFTVPPAGCAAQALSLQSRRAAQAGIVDIGIANLRITPTADPLGDGTVR